MPFDVEGARKAGYSDAEIAAHLAASTQFDLAGAKKAGYSDGEVIAHLAGRPMRTGAAAVPTADEAAGRGYTPPDFTPRPQPTLLDRAVGTGEAALTTVTGATGGTLGMIGGTLKGLAEQILSGQFGTPQAAQMVEQSAAQGAQALTYAPRTPSGQEQAQAVGEALQNLVPVAAVAPALVPPRAAARTPGVPVRAAVEGVVRDVAGDTAAAGAARVGDAVSRAADVAKSTVSTLPRRAREALLREELAATPGTMGSVGAAGTDMAAIRQQTAQSMPVPLTLTRGQATRDPAQLKFEVETAKMPEQGAPLRERGLEQSAAILANMDHWIDQTGAQAPTLRAIGTAVDSALVKQAGKDKAQINLAYKAAERAGEMEAPVQLDSVVAHLVDSAPESATAPLLNVARAKALQLGIATERDGQLVAQPVPLKTVELFRQSIGQATDYTPTNVRQATIIKGLVDQATDGLGGNLYKQARALRARYAQNYEDRAAVAKLLNMKRGTSDRQVALEDVLDHSVLRGSLDDVRNMRRVLQRSGAEGQQAWRELQGGTLAWVKDQATRNVATDSRGNRVISPAGLDKAIRGLDVDGRLEFVFGKKGAQQLRDLNDLAQYVKTVPPEAGVNTSNTAATLLAAFGDIALSGSTGTPVPVITAARIALRHVKDQKLRRRISDALDESQRKQAPGKRGVPLAAPGKKTIH